MPHQSEGISLQDDLQAVFIDARHFRFEHKTIFSFEDIDLGRKIVPFHDVVFSSDLGFSLCNH